MSLFNGERPAPDVVDALMAAREMGIRSVWCRGLWVWDLGNWQWRQVFDPGYEMRGVAARELRVGRAIA